MPSRPARRTFRPRIPGVSSASAKLALALVAGSILWAATGVGKLLPLASFRVIHDLQLWRLITYAFLESSPIGVIFDAFIIWSIGLALEARWGSRRILAFGLGTTFLAAVGTVLLSLLVPTLQLVALPGGAALGTAFWIAYGLSYGKAETNFFGMPLTGNMFAVIGVGFVVLNAAFASWVVVVPDALAIVCTFIYMRGGSPRVFWLRLQHWRLQRQLRGRARHLKLISKDRNTASGSDRFIH